MYSILYVYVDFEMKVFIYTVSFRFNLCLKNVCSCIKEIKVQLEIVLHFWKKNLEEVVLNFEECKKVQCPVCSYFVLIFKPNFSLLFL